MARQHQHRIPPSRLTLLIGSLFALPAIAAEEPRVQLPTVEVVGTMPIPGLGTAKEHVPGALQGASGKEMERQEPLNLPEFMGRNLGSVQVTDTQANPYQPDVHYRGFNASPMLGAAQGLSVYFDGVRINEPFGDVVNWDLLPQSAIASMDLIPGSNPLFGLNTLGGALSVRSKSGAEHAGTSAQAYSGSFARRAVEFQHGGKDGAVDGFVTGNWFKEDGWRDFSPSEVKQLFAKVGRHDETNDIDLGVLLADTDLTGNAFTPAQFLARRREAIYTHPDTTRNNLAFVTLNGSHWLDATRLLSGNVYYRHLNTRTFNADLNEIDDPRNGVVPFEGGPDDADAGGPGLGTDAAADNRSRSRQRGYGFSLQLSLGEAAKNAFNAGVSYDHGQTGFRQTYQLGTFTADRGTVATGAETENVNIDGTTRTASVFFSDTWSPHSQAHLTVSGRYNHTRVQTADRLTVPFPAPAQGLDNDFTYRRFNPALGFTYTPSDRLTAFAGYSQGNRAPSPIELGCSDPASPCRLPNAMASDPFLKQVIARTVEAGLRGKAGEGTEWNVGAFRTDNRDDILFVAVTTGGAGFFQNFGRTRRQGLEAGLSQRTGGFTWSANYSYLEATFQSSGVLQSANNSTRDDLTTGGLDDDQIRVVPGNTLPGAPRHNLKLSASWATGSPWTLGANVVAVSSQFVRGNENNLHQAGTFTNSQGNTRTFVGSGSVPGYAVLNLNARYQVDKRWQLFGRLDNVFDRRYSTAGMLGENAFPDGTFSPDSGRWVKDTFYAPGAPRAAWIGLRYAG